MEVSNLIKSGLSALTKPTRTRNAPLHLQVEPTSRCNLGCYFCSRLNSVKDGKGSDMLLENFNSLLEDVKPLRVTFAGRGEPLLSPNLPKMIGLVKKNGAKSIVTTNFTVGDKYAEKLVSEHLDILRISIDAATPQVYKKIRGRDFFERIIRGIKTVNRAKKNNGSGHPSIGFEFVMTQDNIHQVKDVVLLAGELGIARINFRPLGLVGIEDRKDMLMGLASKDEFKRLLGRARVRSEDFGVKTNLDLLLKDINFYWNRYENRLPPKPIGCLYLWLQIFVSAEGEVSPCCALFMDEGVSMGNVFKNGFEAVWNGERFKEFRQQMKAGQVPYQSCKVCIPKDLTWVVKKIKLLKS